MWMIIDLVRDSGKKETQLEVEEVLPVNEGEKEF